MTGEDTIFDVALESGEATVQPVEGSVSVTGARQGPAAALVRLAPAEVFSVAVSGERPARRGAARSEAVWPQGMLAFDNGPQRYLSLIPATAIERMRWSLAGGRRSTAPTPWPA